MQVEISYKGIFKVAWPIVVAGLAQNIINITDTAFLGRVDEITLAAAAIGGIFYFLFIMLCMGMSIGAQIIIARRTGEGNDHKVGEVFDQSVFLLFVFAILLFLVMKMGASEFLGRLLQSDQVYHEAMKFIDIRMFGIFFVAINMSFRALYIGLSMTKILTLSTFVMAVINVLLDYGFIFGNLGLPEMGIQGAALASFLAETGACLFFVLYTFFGIDRKALNIFNFGSWHQGIKTKILKLSYPSIFQNFFSILAWFTFFIIIEQTGEQQLAISNILRSLLIFFMIPVWGLATATNTMTSNILGQDMSDQVTLLVKRIVLIGSSIMILLLPVSFLKPEWLISIITDDPILIEKTKGPLYIINFALIAFVPSVIFFHALTGTGDTKTAFIIEVICIVSYVSFAYFAAIQKNASLGTIWSSEIIYWSLIGLMAFIRLKGRKWEKIRV